MPFDRRMLVGTLIAVAAGARRLTGLVAVALMIATAMPATAQTLSGAELLAALRAGGFVIYFRHASPGRFAALRALLSTAPPAGTNTAIVGHGYPYYSLIGKGTDARRRRGGLDHARSGVPSQNGEVLPTRSR